MAVRKADDKSTNQPPRQPGPATPSTRGGAGRNCSVSRCPDTPVITARTHAEGSPLDQRAPGGQGAESTLTAAMATAGKRTWGPF